MGTVVSSVWPARGRAPDAGADGGGLLYRTWILMLTARVGLRNAAGRRRGQADRFCWVEQSDENRAEGGEPVGIVEGVPASARSAGQVEESEQRGATYAR